MKKVAICGVGSSLRNFDWDSDYEVWGLNHKHAYKRLDLFFNLHIKEEVEGVITQANFPFDEVYQLRKIPIIDRNTRWRYFQSSMSYMTAYAILKGYDEILYCGCDFKTKDESRTKQKECLEQWIAFAQGRGIKVKVIADSPLCKETGLYIPKQLEEQEIIEDEVPEEVETRAKLGDIWQLGNHRLMCGSSTNPDDVEKLMNGSKADMVFTDPPYGMNLDTDYSSMKSEIFKGGIGGKKYEQGMVDDFKPEMISTILTTFDYVKEIFLWGADYFAELLPNKNDGSWVVWDKRANGDNDLEKDLSSDKMYGSCFELCWSKNKHKRDIARIKWAGIFGMYGEDKKRFHPTQKPQELVKWFLDRYSKEKQTIVDLFGGSGSTLIACEQLDRKCYMMELDPKYCDVILQRYIKFKNSDEDVFLLKDGNKIPYSEAHF